MRKRSLLLILAGAMAVLTAFALTACGDDPKTLEDYIADNPTAREEIRNALADLENDDMELTVAYEGNKIIVTGSYTKKYKGRVLKAMKKSYRKSAKKIRAAAEEAIDWIQVETGFTGVRIDIVIQNGNGKRLWKGSYPRETKVEETTGDGAAGQ